MQTDRQKDRQTPYTPFCLPWPFAARVDFAPRIFLHRALAGFIRLLLAGVHCRCPRSVSSGAMAQLVGMHGAATSQLSLANASQAAWLTTSTMGGATSTMLMPSRHPKAQLQPHLQSSIHRFRFYLLFELHHLPRSHLDSGTLRGCVCMLCHVCVCPCLVYPCHRLLP